MRTFKYLFMGVLLLAFSAMTSVNATQYVKDKDLAAISDAVATGDTVTLYDTSSGNSLQATIAQIYSSAANIGASTIVTVGALDSGSITSNFGNIDNGTSSITSGGTWTVDIDGTAIGAAGAISFGASSDDAIYHDGTNMVHDAATAHDFSIAGTTEGDLAADGMNVITGDTYQINNTAVLSATTLGSGVLSSSLTSLGTITTATVTLANITTLNVSGVATFNGGQTRKHTIFPKSVALASSVPPTSTVTTGGSGNVWQVLQFKADSGAFGDGHVYFPWHVPDGYVVDSGRLNIIWSCESAETAGDTATFDLTVLSPADGETVDASTTSITEVDDTGWAGSADFKQITQLNFEVLTIAVDDTVYFDFSIDESRSAFADSIDVHAFEIEYETTE